MRETEKCWREYKEMQCKVKKEVAKIKQKVYERLDTKGGEKDLFFGESQGDWAGKDVQQVGVIKDRNGNVLPSEKSVLRRWME